MPSPQTASQQPGTLLVRFPSMPSIGNEEKLNAKLTTSQNTAIRLHRDCLLALKYAWAGISQSKVVWW